MNNETEKLLDELEEIAKENESDHEGVTICSFPIKF